MPEYLAITAPQVLIIIRCILETARKGKPKKEIRIQKRSQLMGKPPTEHVDIQAGDGYKLGFAFRGGMVQECIHCSTPTGKLYSQVKQSGSVFSQLNLDDRKYLSRLLLDGCESKRDLSVKEIALNKKMCGSGVGFGVNNVEDDNADTSRMRHNRR